MKKLFVTDLDGTALGGNFTPYDRFPDHFSDFLDDLIADGWDWAINTTWAPEGQWELIKRSKVKSRPRFLIAEMGRQIIEIRNENLYRIQPYTENNNRAIAEYCRNALLPLFHHLFKRHLPKQVLYYEHVVAVLFREDVIAGNIPEIIKAQKSGKFVLTISPHRVSFMPSFLSKGVPMKVLTDEFGYLPENIVCAGDQAPDIEMMKYGVGRLAPQNAADIVKEYLSSHNGFVGNREFAWGVIDAYQAWSNTFNH